MITKIKKTKAYDSVWIKGVEGRALHISKRSSKPEIHVDSHNVKIRHTKAETIISFE